MISLLSKGLSESSPAPQFESINSSVLSLLYGPTLTFVHDYWKNHSFAAPAQGNQSLSRELRASALCPGLEAQFPARRREERGCRPLTGKDRASCQSGGAPALRPGAVAQSPGREVPLRDEGSCGGGGAPRDSAGSGATEEGSAHQDEAGLTRKFERYQRVLMF